MTAVADLPPSALAELAEQHRRAAQAALAEPAALAQFCSPGYDRRPHLDLISREVARIGNGDGDRLLIAVPPQTGKTTLAAVWTPFWWLARQPSERIIIGSYSSNLATARGKQVRKLVATQGWRYNIAVEWGSGQVNDWQLTAGGGCASRGVGAGVTGLPGDLLIIDDPHKSRAEAESKAYRDAVWDWYSADMLSRLAPGAPVILIMTLWHPDDLAHRVLQQDGRVEDGGTWRVVKLPAFADVNDQLGRAPGEPLTHPKIPSDDVEALREFWERRRRSITARDWVSLYMCDPKPMTGALVTADQLRERWHLPPPAAPRRSAVAIDPSGGGRDLAGIIGGFLGTDDRVYITHDASITGPSREWGRAAALLAADIDADVVLYEHNFGGDQAEVVIKSSWEALQRERPDDERFQRLAPKVKPVRARKGKQLRAEPIAQQFVEDRLRLGAKLPELESEWYSWRPSDTESPGRIDASVYLAYELLPIRNEPAEVVAHPAMGGSQLVNPYSAVNPYGTLPGFGGGFGPQPGGRPFG
ncbi:terminase large subunit domain-containing protein [Amycolatopsis thermophila]|uniref:Terminase n=1 Tax=Amycolatopsis thermophila TaxID=206084 RepID=A0ABU0EMJ2_9PSEU|nr:terminase family protein [Amycolatopsis thermophila]MDQ0376505.1 hypothetical protein [Amycolatopsis thermophila]